MEDIIGEPSIDESDGSDSYDLDQDIFNEDVDDDDASSKKGSSKKNIFAKIMGKISGISKFKKIIILIIGLVVLLLAIATGIWIHTDNIFPFRS